MSTVLVLDREGESNHDLTFPLTQAGFATAGMSEPSHMADLTAEQFPDLVLLNMASLTPVQSADVVDFCRSSYLPILALVTHGVLANGLHSMEIDDFLLTPLQPEELVARVRQLLRRLGGRQSEQAIRVGDLVIDQSRYEVTVGGHRVILTFKEYELLRLLASAPGRVFTRDALLSRVWGYNYFGGTRTVDVHVRRLRSKVEDAHHTFIETVWNVGYRLKEPGEAA